MDNVKIEKSSHENETCTDFQQGHEVNVQVSQPCTIVAKCNNKIQKQKTKANKKKNNRQIQLQVQNLYQTVFTNYYVLSGDISVYVGNELDKRDPIFRKVDTIFEQKWHKSMLVENEKVIRNLSLPIQILERSQSQQKYYFAQKLKEYEQLITHIHSQMIKVQNAYKDNPQELNDLIYKRQQYRKRILDENIKETMSQDDFYYIIQIITNFDLNQLSLQQITMSKSLFALIGVDCNDIDSYVLRNGLSDQLFMNEREVIFPAIFDVCYKERNRFYRFKDFQINTLDSIRIYSDAEIMFYNVEYPPELYYKIDDDHFNQNAEMTIKIKYDIQPNHIIQILNIRNQNSEYNNYTQSIDYSILSQIFLDKFYPNQFTEQPETQNVQKECKFRMI